MRKGEFRAERGAARHRHARGPLARRAFVLHTRAHPARSRRDGYNAAQRGEIAENLWVDCVLASNADPTLAPEGRHMLTCFVQYLPCKPAAGSWESCASRSGIRSRASSADYAPNVPGSVIARRVLTPLDLERTFGITEGNIFHGDLSLDQMFFMRPLPGWSRYRTPIEGLYLCGAGTHPGGGVTGAPGHNAAHVMIADDRRPRTARSVELQYQRSIAAAAPPFCRCAIAFSACCSFSASSTTSCGTTCPWRCRPSGGIPLLEH